MKKIQTIYCHLFIREENNTVSSGKSWKEMLQTYLSKVLMSKHKLSIHFVSDEIIQDLTLEERQEAGLLFLSIGEGNMLASSYDKSGFAKVEELILVKDHVVDLLRRDHALRVFDFIFIDAETGAEVKQELLFEKPYESQFLIRVSDLAFELYLLFAHTYHSNIPFIYLAEASADLAAVRASVKKELIRRGFQVLPEKAFPSEEAALEHFHLSDFKKAVLSVHFFGNIQANTHPVTGISMPEYQNKLAATYFTEQNKLVQKGEKSEVKFSRIIWIPEQMKIRQEKYLRYLDSIRREQSLYAGADFIKSTAEELKDLIIKKALLENPNLPSLKIEQEDESIDESISLAPISNPLAKTEQDVYKKL